MPDALFVPDATGEHVDRLKHRAPTRLDLEEIVTTVATRCVRWLEKHGYLGRDGEEDTAENADTDTPWMRCLQGSLGVGELQRWAEHGRAEQNADPARGRSLPKPTKGLGAQHLEFNLHAGVSVPGGLPAARERLLRYCGSPFPRARAAFGARRWQDLLPHQGHRAGAPHDTDAVHGTPCCPGTPTAPSIGALLRSVGAAQPVAQQSGASDSEDQAIHLLRSERPIRGVGGS